MNERETRKCRNCGKVGKVARSYYVCGECFARAEEESSEDEILCCMCGKAAGDDYRCVATDHGPDYVCGRCEYTSDE